jgi:hypothetical protein
MHLVQTDQRLTIPETGSVENPFLPGGRVRGRIDPRPPPGAAHDASLHVLLTLEQSDLERPPSLVGSAPTGAVGVSVAPDGTFYATRRVSRGARGPSRSEGATGILPRSRKAPDA